MKKILSFICFTILSISISGQSFDKNRLVYGGDFGFSFSDDSWSFGLSPQIGYRLNNKLTVGAGLGYNYGRINQDYITSTDGNSWNTEKYRENQNTISLNIFAHVYPWKKLIFSAKPMISYSMYRAKFQSEKYSKNRFIPSLTVGGGVYLRPVMLQINYEIVQDDYSMYSKDVFFSVGLMF